MSKSKFPANPALSQVRKNYVDEIKVISDAGGMTLLSRPSDDSIKSSINDRYRVKCKTAENAFVTFVLHGTSSLESVMAILKSGKLKASRGDYGRAVYVRVNTADRWSLPMDDLGDEVSDYGPFYLVLSVAALDRYRYKVNGTNVGTTIKKESDTIGWDGDRYGRPIKENNISINPVISMAYLQKIWVDYNNKNYDVDELPTIDMIRSIFLEDSILAPYAEYVERMPKVVDSKYFVRYCQDWQTPVHQIGGTVISTDDDDDGETAAPIVISECYLHSDYIRL